MVAKRKGGNGRKKTVPRRIIKEDARYVCFSKRKQGLFNKASEQALLTGAQTLRRQHGEMRTELVERKKRKKSVNEALPQEHATGTR
uniref:Uncharacterized protein n=1 Tax=Aegilops tauschii TaxID=37682 RepID=M8CXQ4_AEGTA